MQDIHPIGGGGGRMFGGGDRRLRPHHQNQALKCPRCDSLNTKFCYYNNYNLSQPRHFCKSCRRYWTKGGVLRNVPVGGGCRKTKRSKPKQSPNQTPRERKSNSNSSSESSSLTAATPATTTTTTTTPTTAADVGSATCLSPTTASFNFPESRFFVPPLSQSTKPNFEHNASEGGMFPEIGSFTSLMTASNNPTSLNFSASDVSPFRLNHNQQQQNHEQQWLLPKAMNDEMTAAAAGFLDQTVHVDLQRSSSNGGGGGGFTALDWQQLQAGGDQGLFEFTGAVDQAYWNQNQWVSSDGHDHSLYLP